MNGEILLGEELIMEPVPKELCRERHKNIDERCNLHKEQIDALFDKVNCIIKGQIRNQWLLIAALCGTIANLLILVTKVIKL